MRAETQATMAFLIDQIAKLLHPFMPFLTEELWAIKGAALAERGLLTLSPGPIWRGSRMPTPRPRSASWSTSSPRCARPAPRPACRPARRSRW